MNRKLIFLVSSVGVSLLIGACEPARETPTTAPPVTTPAPEVPPVTTPAPEVTPTTPTTP